MKPNNFTLKANTESFIESLEELDSLFQMHNLELGFDHEIDKLDLNIPQYEQVELLGNLVFITLRYRSRLVGYMTAFLCESFHQMTLKMCTVDLFFVHPDFRGNSGLKLMIAEAEKELKLAGVDHWYVGTRPTKSKYAGEILQSMGFTSSETFFMKKVN